MTLEEIRKIFKDDSSSYVAHMSSENNSFGGFVLNDDSYQKIGKWVCHGWLSEYGMTNLVSKYPKLKEQGIKYVLSAVMKPHVKASTLKTFVNWLINQSPYAEVFIDKDPDSVIEYGYVVDANFPPEFIASALMASRLITESYLTKSEVEGRCKAYEALLDIGCSGDEAFLFSYLYTSRGKGKETYPMVFARWSSGHSPFYSNNFQENYLRNFLNHNPVNLGDKRLTNAIGYGHETVSRIWGDKTSKDSFGTKMMAIIPDSKSEKEDLHIFRMVVKAEYAYKDKEDFASVIKQLKEMIYA